MEFDKFYFEENIYEALELMNFKNPTPVVNKKQYLKYLMEMILLRVHKQEQEKQQLLYCQY